MRALVLLAVIVATRAAEPFRLASTTAARTPNAIVCTISWNATPPQFGVTQYSIYEADAVTGPYTLISQSDTNEILLVVEPGTHFWNVRALSVWNGATNESPPSASVGMIDSAPGGVGVKKVVHKKTPDVTVPDALLIPAGAWMPAPTNEAARPPTRSQSLPVPTSDHAYLAPASRFRTIPSRRAPSYSLGATNVMNTTPPPGARDPLNPNALPTP